MNPFCSTDWQNIPAVATPSSVRNGAFTLVEIMAAVSVLSLMMALLLQMSGYTIQATHAAQQQMSAAEGCQNIINTLNHDLENVMLQGGLPILVNPDGANTKLAFLTCTRGPVGTADYRLMAVAYQLDAENRVVRSTLPVTWADTDLLTKMMAATSSTTSSVLAENILRFQAGVILDAPSNGQTIQPLSPGGTTWLSGTTSSGDIVTDNFLALHISRTPVDLHKPRARTLLVTIAGLDGQTFRLPGVKEMSNKLPAPAAGQTALEKWTNQIETQALAGFPKPAIAALQISQGHYPLE